MSIFSNEKRKNDSPRRVPRWLLLVALGFVLGVIATVAITTMLNTPPPASNDSFVSVMTVLAPMDVEVTATALIYEATNYPAVNGLGTPMPPPLLDETNMTVTAIIAGRTQTVQAFATPGP